MKLEAALSRLGTHKLSQLLGRQTIQLLEAFDEKNLTPARLAGLIVRQIGAEDLLLKEKFRVDILQALTREQAQRLSRAVGVVPDDRNPWSALTNLAFRRGQTRTEALFAFFGERAPRPNDRASLSQEVVRSQYPLFDHQQRAYREVMRYLTRAEVKRVLLHMPTGSGKTRTALNAVASYLREWAGPGQVVVWLAHTEELCDQAAQEFQRAWRIIGNGEVQLSRHYGSHRVAFDTVKHGLLIAGLQLLYQHSLRHQSAFLRLAKRTRLVVMDEAHQATAPTYNHLLRLLAPDERATAVLGLSATPGRSMLDAHADLALANFFQRQKVTLEVAGYSNPVEYLQAEGYLARVHYDYVHFQPKPDFVLTRKEKKELEVTLDLPSSAISRLGQDVQRNLLILSRVIAEAAKGSKILVFACDVPHANLLADLLRAKGYQAAAITAATPRDRRKRLIEQYRDTDELQILTNYGVLTTGFDAPRTNVAVIARPTRSVVLYSQMVGRAARGPKAGGNESCRVITVVDRIHGFRSIAEAFDYWEDIWSA